MINGQNLLEYRRASNDKEGSFLLLLFLSRAPVTRDSREWGTMAMGALTHGLLFCKGHEEGFQGFLFFLVLESGLRGEETDMWRNSIGL